jgi:hypothetical protein
MRSGRRQVSTLRWTRSTSLQLIRTRSDVSALAIPSRARWCRVLPVGRNEGPVGVFWSLSGRPAGEVTGLAAAQRTAKTGVDGR